MQVDRESNSDVAEAERIQRIYKARLDEGREALCAWHRPEVRQQASELHIALANMLPIVLGHNLGTARFLDVGCGNGAFLRLLLEWGARPEKLVGTELQRHRIATARELTPKGPTWHVGQLGSLTADRPYDLVSAFTVFSSVLDPALREALASEMWNRVAPGGAALVFDFRYDNPSNPDVRKVTRNEVKQWWPHAEFRCRTLILAPPLARVLTPVSPRLAAVLGTIPFLRSHFLILAQKPRLDGE